MVHGDAVELVPKRWPPPRLTRALARRNLSLHEYQALQIFQDFGVATPKVAVAFTASEAADKAKEFGGEVMMKTQVLAGGLGLFRP